jgi:hypothetical protein
MAACCPGTIKGNRILIVVEGSYGKRMEVRKWENKYYHPEP